MPTTLLRRQAGDLLQRPDHRVERVGDADDEGVGRMGLDAGADRLHHLQIDAEQVVAAHAGLARHAGGDDDDVGAGDRRVGARAGELGVEAFDRRRTRRDPAPCPAARRRRCRTGRCRRVPSAPPDGPACRRSGRRRSGQSSCAPWNFPLSRRRRPQRGGATKPRGLSPQRPWPIKPNFWRRRPRRRG